MVATTMGDREICRTKDDIESMAIYGPEGDSQEEPEWLDTAVEQFNPEAPCWNSLAQQNEVVEEDRMMKKKDVRCQNLFDQTC